MPTDLNILCASILTGAFVLSACSGESGLPVETPPSGPIANQDASTQQNEIVQSSYASYCFERVGQVGAEPRRGDVCTVRGGGAGGTKAGIGSPARNDASLFISAPSLTQAGIKSVSFVLSRGAGAPKFFTGAHEMDQTTLMRGPIKDLPDRIVFVSDATGQESIFSYTAPDAAFLRENGGDVDWPGYEIASAVLMINSATDLEVDEMGGEMAQAVGMTTGEQYIEGTLTISLIPMGSKGEQYGPTTFEFGDVIEWGYMK